MMGVHVKKTRKIKHVLKTCRKMAIFGYDSRELKLLVIIALFTN